jgi:hypothetical protein
MPKYYPLTDTSPTLLRFQLEDISFSGTQKIKYYSSLSRTQVKKLNKSIQLNTPFWSLLSMAK